MHRVKICSDVPSIFANKLPILPITRNFSKNNVALRKYLSHKSKYKISIRGPSLLSSNEKELQEIESKIKFKTFKNGF